MIYGIGTDIVNVKRLEKGRDFLNRFIKHSLTDDEQQQMARRGLADISAEVLYLAKRFAAKEAVVKAIGTGFRDGIYLSDISILNDDDGRPLVTLSGNAAKYVQKNISRNYKIHLSLSDDYPFAVAFAVLEA